MEELLLLNDALTSLLQHFSPRAHPLDDLEGFQNGHPQSPLSTPCQQSGSSNSLGLENGHAHGSPVARISSLVVSVPGHESDGDEPEPFSPRVDKGKGKAKEESSPVLQKLIMSPAFSSTDSDDEDERRRAAEDEVLEEHGDRPPVRSPTDRSVLDCTLACARF